MACSSGELRCSRLRVQTRSKFLFLMLKSARSSGMGDRTRMIFSVVNLPFMPVVKDVLSIQISIVPLSSLERVRGLFLH